MSKLVRVANNSSPEAKPEVQAISHLVNQDNKLLMLNLKLVLKTEVVIHKPKLVRKTMELANKDNNLVHNKPRMHNHKEAPKLKALMLSHKLVEANREHMGNNKPHNNLLILNLVHKVRANREHMLNQLKVLKINNTALPMLRAKVDKDKLVMPNHKLKLKPRLLQWHQLMVLNNNNVVSVQDKKNGFLKTFMYLKNFEK